MVATAIILEIAVVPVVTAVRETTAPAAATTLATGMTAGVTLITAVMTVREAAEMIVARVHVRIRAAMSAGAIITVRLKLGMSTVPMGLKTMIRRSPLLGCQLRYNARMTSSVRGAVPEGKTKTRLCLGACQSRK